MPHRVVTGHVQALEAALAEHVFDLKANDALRPVVILVGGTLLRPYLRRRLAELGGAHMNVHVLTPSELGLLLGERRVIAQGRSPLPLLADRVLAHEAALQTEGYFDAVRDTPGFGHALHRTLLELRRNLISPQNLAEWAGQVDETEKVSALAELAAKHEALRTDHYDTDVAFSEGDPTCLPANELLIYGLWDAPANLRRAIASVAIDHPVTAYLPTAHPVADRAHEDLRRWLAAELAASEAPATTPSCFPATNLSHLQATLSTAPTAPSPAPDDASVQLISAPDPSREVRAALRQCIEWADNGIPFHEMAIVYRHPEPYRPLLSALAREAKLPVYDHEGTPLAEMPTGRRTLALLDLLEGDLDRGSVIAFANDSRLPKETRKRYAGSAAQWDRVAREAGVMRGKDQWAERLAAHRERTERRYSGEDRQPPAWLPDRLAQIDGLNLFVEELAGAIDSRPTSGTWSTHIDHLTRLFDTYLRDHDKILDSVRGLARLDALTGSVSDERFGAVVRGVVDGLRAEDVTDGRTGAFRARGVNVLDANSLRHLRFRAVVVLGLAERSFPPAPREDPLLLDAERSIIGLPARAKGADPEPLQFALATQAASDHLLLTYPRTEHGSGRPQFPSNFIRAAAEAIAGERISAEELPNREDPWLMRIDADHVGAETLESALDIGEYDRTLLEAQPEVGIALMSARLPGAARGRAAQVARLESGLLSVYEGGLSVDIQDELASHLRLTGAMSPTALETFATCPMRFFLSNILGLRELEDPDDLPQISPLERGSLMHTVMERAMRSWLPGEPPSMERRTAQIAELERITTEECEEVERQGLTGYPALWAADRQAIFEDLRLWYDAEAADDSARYDAADFEVGFGMRPFEGDGPRSTSDPLELVVGGLTLRLRGRLDRLQWDEAGREFRIVDYKTGKSRERKKTVFDGGKALQLPLYLHAAGDLILGRDWRDGRAEYFYSTRKGGFRRVEITGEMLTDRRPEFERIMETFGEAIASGTFPARPAEWTCKWCDFVSLCPAAGAHEAQMRRKAADPRVQILTDLEEID